MKRIAIKQSQKVEIAFLPSDAFGNCVELNAPVLSTVRAPVGNPAAASVVASA